MKYRLVAKWDVDHFMAEVQTTLTEGWKPQGGVSVSTVYDHDLKIEVCHYAQAFVKEKPTS